MVHESQRLALGFETSEYLCGVHAALDELQSNLALDRLELLGFPDLSHTAFTDLLEKTIVANHPSFVALAGQSCRSVGIDR